MPPKSSRQTHSGRRDGRRAGAVQCGTGERDDSQSAFLGDREVTFPGGTLGDDCAREPDQVVGGPQAWAEQDHARGRGSPKTERQLPKILVEGQKHTVFSQGEGQYDKVG